MNRSRVKILLWLGVGGAVIFLAAMIPDFYPTEQEKNVRKQLNECASRIAEPNRIMTNALAESDHYLQIHDDAKAAYYTGVAIDASTNVTEIYFEFKPIKEKQEALKNARHAELIFKLFLAGGCAVFAFPWLLYLFLVPEKKP